MPPHKATLAEQYDQSLLYGRGKHLPADAPRPWPTTYWCQENLELFEHYRAWLLQGGASALASRIIYLPMAGHVLGLNLKPHPEIDLDDDLECAIQYVQAKQCGKDWVKACRNGLNKFRRFLRLERGLGEENKITPFDSARVTVDLPQWLVKELERYQRLMQRNWRDARVEQNIRRFWSGYLSMWRFFVEQKNVQELADLKRQHILDYVDHRLSKGYAVTGVNNDLRNLHTFLLFLQEQGYSVSQSLLRIPGLKQPDPLPRYLTDEQVKKLRDEIERGAREAKLASHRRLALLIRAAFYLLWQAGMRLGEVEELRLEDVDWQQHRLSVRDGKGKKDRTVYLTETTIHALRDYLAVRGAHSPQNGSGCFAKGSGEHVFLYRNAPLKKDLLRAQLKYAGQRVGVKVYPHRLRHTCATQLLNAGCRVTSIQRFLGHKDLASTMIYARAHDQTVADDYFAATERVEQRLEIAPFEKKEKDIVDVKVQKQANPSIGSGQRVFQLLARLELPQLCYEERLDLASQLRMILGEGQVQTTSIST